jgi:hypothetical protein
MIYVIKFVSLSYSKLDKVILQEAMKIFFPRLKGYIPCHNLYCVVLQYLS